MWDLTSKTGIDTTSCAPALMDFGPEPVDWVPRLASFAPVAAPEAENSGADVVGVARPFIFTANKHGEFLPQYLGTLAYLHNSYLIV